MKVAEIFESEQFKKFVSGGINEIEKAYRILLNSSKNRFPKLKSNAFSTLDKKGMLNPEKLSAEYMLIVEKKSTLPIREREWIQSFVRDCIMKTVLFYFKLEKEQLSKIAQESVKQEPIGIPKVKKPRKKKEL